MLPSLQTFSGIAIGLQHECLYVGNSAEQSDSRLGLGSDFRSCDLPPRVSGEVVPELGQAPARAAGRTVFSGRAMARR